MEWSWLGDVMLRTDKRIDRKSEIVATEHLKQRNKAIRVTGGEKGVVAVQDRVHLTLDKEREVKRVGKKKLAGGFYDLLFHVTRKE